MKEKDYTPPVLNLVFHVKLWMKHGLRGLYTDNKVIIFNSNKNNGDNGDDDEGFSHLFQSLAK